MKTTTRKTTLREDIDNHNLRVKYRKTLLKSFVGGMVLASIAIFMADTVTDFIISLIK